MKNVVAVALVAFAAASWPIGAQEKTLRADRTVEYRTGRANELKITVGTVRIDSVEFSDLGQGYGRGVVPGNIAGRILGTSGSEASTTIRARFVAENPMAQDWSVRFTLEFLDKSGALIEKVSKSESWEGEAKPYNFEHPMLSYVVPMIARVRISMEAKLD